MKHVFFFPYFPRSPLSSSRNPRLPWRLFSSHSFLLLVLLLKGNWPLIPRECSLFYAVNRFTRLQLQCRRVPTYLTYLVWRTRFVIARCMFIHLLIDPCSSVLCGSFFFFNPNWIRSSWSKFLCTIGNDRGAIFFILLYVRTLNT